MEEKYLLIIDTEKYAGGFEREMCAYTTGQLGECGVGSKEADIFREEVDKEAVEWLDNNIENVSDNHGVFRPVCLSATPGWFNSGMGKMYRDSEQVDGATKYPAYLSIEIMFYEKPSDSLIDLITQRAHKFCKDKRVGHFRPKKITAVRLVKRVTKDIELLRK
jgi:hypothetical protein